MSLTFGPKFRKELAVESWTLYSLGMFSIFLRFFVRLRRGGIRALTVDDYLMLAVAALYTTLIICLNVIVAGGGSNLYLPEEFATFTPKEIKERIKGSKVVVVSEQAMLNLIYVLKACMICIYGRLTLQLKHSIFVKGVAIYSACGYVGSQLAFFLACRPFYGYWQMPPPNPQCTTLQHYAITQACFNTTSDALMLAISIPLLLSTTLPTKQKIVLVLIFSMGLFVILAAILTKVFNLKDPYSSVYMLWYVRESSVAIFVVNLPLLWPLLRETFPFLKSFTPGQKTYSEGQSRWKGISGTTTRTRTTVKTGHAGGRSGLGTHISVVERGLEMMGMEKMRKRNNDSISVHSDEQAFNMGGINQEMTVEVEVTSMTSTEVGTSYAAGISMKGGGPWEEDAEAYRTYHTQITSRAECVGGG